MYRQKNANKYQDFGVIKYTKSGNTNTAIVSQDFGENKYSKKIRVTTQILQLCHKTLE